MSVRAYLVKKDYKMIDNKEYVHEEHEYLWNNWSESEIWDILYPLCNDMTNDDCIGNIEICYCDWESLIDEYKIEDSKTHKVVEKYKDVFSKIDCEFKNGEDFIEITLY